MVPFSFTHSLAVSLMAKALSPAAAFLAMVLLCVTVPSTFSVPERQIVFHQNQTVAVFLAGQRLRFLPHSFIKNVVGAAARDGFVVHVYVSLVRFDPNNATQLYKYLGRADYLAPDPLTGLCISVCVRVCSPGACTCVGCVNLFVCPCDLPWPNESLYHEK